MVIARYGITGHADAAPVNIKGYHMLQAPLLIASDSPLLAMYEWAMHCYMQLWVGNIRVMGFIIAKHTFESPPPNVFQSCPAIESSCVLDTILADEGSILKWLDRRLFLRYEVKYV